MTEKPKTDWEAIEREHRAGQLSIREIAKRYGVSDTAIRKMAKAHGWQRSLAEKVRREVREKLVREDGSQNQRASDAEVVEAAANRGSEVVQAHRRDILQLHRAKRILATRLEAYLSGETPDGPFMGDKESPADVLEKLSRVNSRLIPLERQAHNLDDENPQDGITINITGDDAAL